MNLAKSDVLKLAGNLLITLILISGLRCGTIDARASVFTLSTNYSFGANPSGVVLANLRGKNLNRDLAVTLSGENAVGIRMSLDNGNFGHLDKWPVDLNPVAVVNGDFNRDGLDDLATANFDTNTVSVLMNLGVGANFSISNYVVGSTSNPGPDAIIAADVNKDGRIDLIVANFNENSVTVLTNQGGGRFGALGTYPTGNNPGVNGLGPSALTLADMDGDGLLDIVTANKVDGSVSILPGHRTIASLVTNGVTVITNFNYSFGSAQIVNYAGGTSPQPSGIIASDLDGDGIPDLVLADSNSGDVSVLLGYLPSGVWGMFSETAYAVGNNPVALSLRDFNHDKIPDIAVVNQNDDNVQILLGLGGGSFQSEGLYSVGSSPSGIAAGNLNGDGAPDLAVANAGSGDVSVLLFSAPLAYDFSQVVLENSTTNMVLLRGAMLGVTNLNFLVASLPTNGTLYFSNSLVPLTTNDMIFDPSTNLLYRPDVATNYFGSDSFTFVTVDTNSAATSVVARASINVWHVNQQPGFSLTATPVTVLEDSGLTNITGFVTTNWAGPSNESAQRVSFVVTPASRSFFSTPPSISSSGTLSFRPALNVTGTTTVSVTARDNGGRQFGGRDTSAVQTFNVTVTPHPIKPHRGLFSGLYYDMTGGPSYGAAGFFSFTLAGNGSFSGALISESGRDAFTGQFDLGGHAVASVTRRHSTPVSLDMQLDLSGATEGVTGSANNAGWNTDLLGYRQYFNTRTNPCPWTNNYTMAIPGNAVDPISEPGGDSIATVNVAADGTVRANVRLSDNTTLIESVGLSKNAQWPFYGWLYSGKGLVIGWINFTNLTDHSLDGDVAWIKTPFASQFYPSGFSVVNPVVGSTYNTPPAGQRVLNLTSCQLVKSGGNLDSPLTNNAYLTVANIAFNQADNAYLLQLATPTNGAMNGTFVHPATGQGKLLTGVALQQQNVARGFFTGTNQSGSFLLGN